MAVPCLPALPLLMDEEERLDRSLRADLWENLRCTHIKNERHEQQN